MKPYQNYQRIGISTADPVRIVVLLYEGAIRNLHQAVRAFGQNNELASVKINKTLDIINYLRNALDHERGGEIAFNLERLYEFMRDELSEANLKLDKEKIQGVTGLLQTLLEGWRGVVSNATTAGDADESAVPPAPEHPLSMVG
jgi:flagellar secretion chaperone FliS